VAQKGGKLPERPREYEGEPAQPYWPLFIEKLLLAIIDANPPDDRPALNRAADKKRQKRLEKALEALFGLERRSGPKRKYALHAAAAAAKRYVSKQSMAAFEEQILKWPKHDRTRAPSKASAFRGSTGLIEGNSQESRAERIEEFTTAHDEYVRETAAGYSHFEEEDMARDLFAVARVLRHWNVSLSIDPEALGMASLWGGNAHQITPQSEEKGGDK
jgi:hypothetical protein